MIKTIKKIYILWIIVIGILCGILMQHYQKTTNYKKHGDTIKKVYELQNNLEKSNGILIKESESSLRKMREMRKNLEKIGAE